MLNHIKAIGFDLFNTLITVEPDTLDEANDRLIKSLGKSGITLDRETFRKAHLKAAMHHLEECRKDGRETHNRFWISTALESEGYPVPPDDHRISDAVEAYFSAFYPHCRLIPGTKEMLQTLKREYHLGLLSNFTHTPAAKKIIRQMGLDPFFETILISGELGYRKPHPLVFQKLLENLQVENYQALYVGDDPEPDITGALGAGILPIWTTYVRDRGLPHPPGILARGEDSPSQDVLSISTWKDLIALLEEAQSSTGKA